MIIRKPGQAISSRPPPKDARAAAIEKSIIRAFKLECQHYMNRELTEFYGTLTLLGKITFWCDHCEEWKSRLIPPKKEPLPEEPLF